MRSLLFTRVALCMRFGAHGFLLVYGFHAHPRTAPDAFHGVLLSDDVDLNTLCAISHSRGQPPQRASP